MMQKQNTQVRADLERESANRITLEATIEQKDDLIRTLRGSGTTYTNGASSSLRVCTVCTCSALKEVYGSLVYSMNFIGVHCTVVIYQLAFLSFGHGKPPLTFQRMFGCVYFLVSVPQHYFRTMYTR